MAIVGASKWEVSEECCWGWFHRATVQVSISWAAHPWMISALSPPLICPTEILAKSSQQPVDQPWKSGRWSPSCLWGQNLELEETSQTVMVWKQEWWDIYLESNLSFPLSVLPDLLSLGSFPGSPQIDSFGTLLCVSQPCPFPPTAATINFILGGKWALRAGLVIYAAWQVDTNLVTLNDIPLLAHSSIGRSEHSMAGFFAQDLTRLKRRFWLGCGLI